MRLIEADGKILLRRRGLSVPRGLGNKTRSFDDRLQPKTAANRCALGIVETTAVCVLGAFSGKVGIGLP